MRVSSAILKELPMLNRFVLVWSVVALSPTWLGAESAPQVLAEGQGQNGPKQPQAFMSADGTVDVVVAVGEEIRLSTSSDRGESFTRASSVIRCSNMSAGMRRGPRVVRTPTAVVVTAIGGKQGKGRDGDLLAWHSTDDGTTWSEAVMVNDVPDAAREGLHGMTAGANGDVWCVWLDLRNGKTEIATAVSSDDGQTWKGNVRAYRSPDGSVCECCHPSIISGPKSGITIMFRNALGGQRDMFLTSSDDGKKFTTGRKLGKGSWKLDACPMDGGMLACDGQDGLVTVWRRDNQVFATLGSGAAEKPLGPGQQPWAAWSAAGPIIVWTGGREGALSMQVGLTGKARQVAATARDPVVASNPQSDFALVCWEAKQGRTTAVMAQVIATSTGASKKAR
ncbi:MAG: hypothetical protein B7Z55_02000 [Planctomycetales bacterium 12-60-4]|nr:MAG: hypothetical protein B7Z55_02000 [Planctomycetales bacterium 12-60-4]